MGTVDELNSHLGLIKAMLSNENTWQFSWLSACNFIEKIQKKLMKLMSHTLDVKNCNHFFSVNDVKELEFEIGRLTAHIPKTTKFVVPGKNIIEAQIHIGRTVARRAERLFAAVNEEQPLCPQAASYLNKLSDYLFFLSQQESSINVNFINQISGI